MNFLFMDAALAGYALLLSVPRHLLACLVPCSISKLSRSAPSTSKSCKVSPGVGGGLCKENAILSERLFIYPGIEPGDFRECTFDKL